MVMVGYGFFLLSSHMAELVERWRILVVLFSGVMMTLLAVLACVATKRSSSWCLIWSFFTVCMVLLALYVSGAISATIGYVDWVSIHSEVGHQDHYAPEEWTPGQRGSVVKMRGTFFEMWGTCEGGECEDDGKCLEDPVKLTEVVCEGESSLGAAFTRWQEGVEHESKSARQPYFWECKNSTRLTEPSASEGQINSWCASLDTLLYRTQNWNFYNMLLMWALTVVMLAAVALNAMYLLNRRKVIMEEHQEIVYISRTVSGSNWWLRNPLPPSTEESIVKV
ncbi:hypothetical protein FOZ61_002998 [Perkinsus olseni]|uniref:Uncharacterized protein n=2 Tax=Perkinsus olseni TaxID=32597 RepID=A0A7J6MDW5_PEROL|nr:hypothetical protein FOZ61_002998 [Perkinsus olseni]